ncbi:MAG: hypothetical protein FD181_1516 [Prolixibacteraceae bacterium]|nr:MAG: hypothetical protein FD181_1516 [Prolixibacteraceae bacterium]
MKNVFILIMLMVFSATSFGQISPAVKFSVGYPYVLDEDDSKSPDFHTVSTNIPTFSLEKPFPIKIRLRNRMSINPGVAWHFFREHEVKGNQTDGKDFKLNHYSLNGYVKVLYQAKFRGKTEAFVYGGGVGGINFITKTKGTKYVYGLSTEIPEYNNPIYENASDFFEMFYYGALIGFQPNARKYNFVKPSFEVAFFPQFISKPNEVVPITYKDINVVQFSVFLGFRIK